METGRVVDWRVEFKKAKRSNKQMDRICEIPGRVSTRMLVRLHGPQFKGRQALMETSFLAHSSVCLRSIIPLPPFFID